MESTVGGKLPSTAPTMEASVAQLCKDVESLLKSQPASKPRDELYASLRKLLSDGSAARNIATQSQEQKEFWTAHIGKDITDLMKAEDEIIIKALEDSKKCAAELAQAMKHPWPDTFKRAREVLSILTKVLRRYGSDAAFVSLLTAVSHLERESSTAPSWPVAFQSVTTQASEVLKHRLVIELQSAVAEVTKDVNNIRAHRTTLSEIRRKVNELCNEAEKHAHDIRDLDLPNQNILPVGSGVWIVQTPDHSHITLMIAAPEYKPRNDVSRQKPQSVPAGRLFQSRTLFEDVVTWARCSTTYLHIHTKMDYRLIGKTQKAFLYANRQSYISDPLLPTLQQNGAAELTLPYNDDFDHLLFDKMPKLPIFGSEDYFAALMKPQSRKPRSCVSDTVLLAETFAENELIKIDDSAFLNGLCQTSLDKQRKEWPLFWKWAKSNGIHDMTAKGLPNDSLWFTENPKDFTRIVNDFTAHQKGARKAGV